MKTLTFALTTITLGFGATAETQVDYQYRVVAGPLPIVHEAMVQIRTEIEQDILAQAKMGIMDVASLNLLATTEQKEQLREPTGNSGAPLPTAKAQPE